MYLVVTLKYSLKKMIPFILIDEALNIEETPTSCELRAAVEIDGDISLKVSNVDPASTYGGASDTLDPRRSLRILPIDSEYGGGASGRACIVEVAVKFD